MFDPLSAVTLRKKRSAESKRRFQSRKSGETSSIVRKTTLSRKSSIRKRFAILGALAALITLIWYYFRGVDLQIPELNKQRRNNAPFTMFTLMQAMDEDLINENRGRFIHQFNALKSWANLSPRPRILAFVSDEFSCEFLAKEIPEVECMLEISCSHPKLKRTMINCIWRTAHELADTEILVYANADIVLLQDFAAAISRLRSRFSQFLMIGRRVDIEDPNPRLINFQDPKWENNVRELALSKGKLHGEFGLDYWVHFKSSLRFNHSDALEGKQAYSEKVNFPEFLAGVFRWDNHLLSEFIKHSRIPVIDATNSVLAVHQDDIQNIDHRGRYGAEYNDQLTRKIGAKQYLFGNVYFADMLLSGDCKRGKCSLSRNLKRSEEPISITRKMNGSKMVLILVTYSGSLNFTKNWICWSRRIGFDRFVILALDKNSHRKLSSLSWSSVAYPIEIIAPPNWAADEVKVFDSSNRQFSQLSSVIFQLCETALSYDVGFFLTFATSIPFEDPLIKISKSEKDLRISNDPGASKFLSLVPSKKSSKFLDKLKKCHQSKVSKLEQSTVLKFWQIVNGCVDSLKSQVSTEFMTVELFPSADFLFNNFASRRAGVYPKMVFVKEGQDKAEEKQKIQSTLLNWKLWAVDQTGSSCLNSLIPNSLPRKEKLSLYESISIRLLFNGDVKSVNRILQKLREVRFGGRSVDLAVGISSELQNSASLLRSMIEKFHWPTGKVSLFDYTESGVDLSSHWLSMWAPGSHDDFLVIINDQDGQIEIGKYFYYWLRKAISFMMAHCKDESIIGIVLEHDNTAKIDYNTLGLSNFYLHQLYIGKGIAFLPGQWELFHNWVNEKMKIYGDRIPCLPLVNSSNLFSSELHNIWMLWLNRYLFEEGKFVINLNPRNIRATMCDVSDCDSSVLMNSISSHELDFSSLEDYATSLYLFDQNYQIVKGSRLALRYRSLTYGPDTTAFEESTSNGCFP